MKKQLEKDNVEWQHAFENASKANQCFQDVNANLLKG
jgi:hypothetical protein